MAKKKGMDQAAYEVITKRQENNWDENVVLLRKAIQYIDDKQDTLWGKIMPLLPGERPGPEPGERIKGLEAIIIVRNYLVDNGYFEMQKKIEAFRHTYKWELEKYEQGLRNGKVNFGFDWDGFNYSKPSNTELRMTWVYNKKYMDCFETFQVPLESVCVIVKSIITCKKSNQIQQHYFYVDAVDHFYTNLIWLVVSGSSTFAFGGNKNEGLCYTIADILGFEPENYVMSRKELKKSKSKNDKKVTFSDVHAKMLSDAAKELK